MDAVLDSAVDLAREAAIEVADGAEWVGDHLGAHAEEDRLVTHLFSCTMPGYRGWVWSVTVSRAPRAREAKLCEAHLVPADDALLAPAWIPWADRVRPGDLEPSMVLPKIQEDPRLQPAYEATTVDNEDAMELWELGLGRERVLGAEGRDSAVTRWMRGSHGPTAASAIASAQPCSTCAFFIPLTGSLRTAFGACANEWSPADGTVVAVDHGCGAHSQTDVEQQSTRWPSNDPIFDTDAVEGFDRNAVEVHDLAPEQAESATDVVGDAAPKADADVAADEAAVTHQDGGTEAEAETETDVESGAEADARQDEPALPDVTT